MNVSREIDRKWHELSEEVISGMKEWRLQHPQATLNEIEAAIDERLNRLRKQMVEDVALASRAAEWSGGPAREVPLCPQCQMPLQARGRRLRQLQTQGGQLVVLQREYGVCPQCGQGLFPPG